MKKSLKYSIVAVIIVVGSIASFVFFGGERSGEVTGSLGDALSGDAVWQARIVIGGKSIMKYRTNLYALTRIPPGSHTLTVTAPSYYDFTKTIQVKRGKNVVDVALRGKEVIDMQGIIIFTESKDEGIEIEIRMTNSKGEGVVDYPMLPVTIDGALFMREGDEDEYSKGEKLFEGPIEHVWDSQEWLAKNKGFIPWDKIDTEPAKNKYGILDMVFHSPQGDFEDYSTDVRLFREEER